MRRRILLRAAREPEQLALLEPLADAYGEDWWFLSAHAFALCEVGQWAQGRELIERSLVQFPRNALAAHIRVHTLYESGEDEAARAYCVDNGLDLEAVAPELAKVLADNLAKRAAAAAAA